jgi:ABC-type sugar transport systems, ATPase components
MARIELIDVVKRFKGETVIPKLNLTIREGSFTVLVGPSGCGKSTTLRMIAGLERQTSGDIRIDGACMNDVEPGKRDVAMVFQNYALYPNMTVRGNIEFGLKNRGVPRPDRERLVRDICEIVGLTPHLDKKPHSLSGGQRQRVALARAMVKKPKVFILDEPLSNLDAKLRGQMRTELIELHRRLGATFVYVTHDQVEAMSMGDRIVVMNRGEVMQSAAPMELYNDPDNLFAAQFIGTPPMNVLPLSALPGLRTEGEGDPAFVGFRPEHARLAPESTELPRDGIVIAGEIATRESLGAEQVCKLRSDAGTFFVKSFLNPYSGGDFALAVVPCERLYFFDRDGSRLRRLRAVQPQLAAAGV